MPKTSQTDEKYMTSETGNWNVADTFAKVKIMGPIIKCEVYEDIALNGYEDFADELLTIGVPSDELRIRGLRRLINELIRLTKNADFAMKKDNTKNDLKKYKQRLQEIRGRVFGQCFRKGKDESVGRSFLIINKSIFDLVLEKVSEIKSEINLPLNKNHLIFTDKEEFDPRAFKERIKKRIIEQG